MNYLLPELALVCVFASALRAADPPALRRIPVILDTDIGDDIDDTWAVVMLLKSPALDVKLITTTNGQADYRTRLLAKLLTIAGRTDIPIGRGAGEFNGEQKLEPWLKDFSLRDYKGKVFDSAPDALITTVHGSKEPITVIAIGPLQTLAAAVTKDPTIAAKCNYVGMQGSVYVGYGGAKKPAPEWNVKCNVPAAKVVLSAPWRSVTITPLDTCGHPNMVLDGGRFESIKKSADPLARAIVESYAIWSKTADVKSLTKSTTLYDTVAVYLAQEHSDIELEPLKIEVASDGVTAVSEHGAQMSVATRWKNLDAYRDKLVRVLVSPVGERK